MVFRLGFFHILKYNHTFDEVVQTLTIVQTLLELDRGDTEAVEALYKISGKTDSPEHELQSNPVITTSVYATCLL